MRRLTLMVHGEPGSGKSWLVGSAPKPLLLLDSEGRAEYLADLEADPSGRTPYELTYWNPRDPVPEDHGPVVVVDVQSYEDIDRAMGWLQAGKHPFRSVGVDSITEMQQRLIDKVAGLEKMQFDHWGEILRSLEKFVRSLRDLRKHPTKPIDVVVVTAGTHDKGGRNRPMLQGQISVKIAHHFDVVGYMAKMKDKTTGERHRIMLIDGYVDNIQAKDNTHVLSATFGDDITDPTIPAMLTALNPTKENN